MPEYDRRKLSAVVGFSPVVGASIAEETVLFTQGVAVDTFDGSDARDVKRRLDESGEVEKKTVRARRHLEVTLVLGIPIDERLPESAIHLVSSWADAGSDTGDGRRRVCSQADHRGDRGFDDAVERTPPAGVSGGDHVGGGIRQKDGRAVRRQNSEGDPRQVGCQRVRPDRRSRVIPIVDGMHVGAVDLMDGSQIRRIHAENLRHSGSVGRDVVAVVGRAETAVQRSVYAVRDAAPARKKAMRNSGGVGQIPGLKRRGSVS